MDLKNPTRTEALLANIAGHTDVPVPDMKNATRSERLLKEILDNGGGGGGDVTKEYVDTAIADAVADIDDDISALSDTVADKVDKENGKSLSTNDYTDADKALVQDSPITVTATGAEITASTAQGSLNALTVYGKSEVVDGAITSAGEGYTVVDLGTITDWAYNTTSKLFYSASLPNSINNENTTIHCYCARYNSVIGYSADPNTPSINNPTYDKSCNVGSTFQSVISNLLIRDSDYTDVTAFKNSLNGVLLCYQLADPTQGNTIAIKTDNGSGIDGTMATFSTGTPLRGIPDSDVRDVMEWNGSAGTVTKNCRDVDLGTLTWSYNDVLHCFQSGGNLGIAYNAQGLLPLYTLRIGIDAAYLNEGEYTLDANGRVYIKDNTYADATAFKTAMNGVHLIYELATPTAQPLSSTENASLAALRTFTPQTHAQNNAGAMMTVEAYAGTENGKAVQELQEQIDEILSEAEIQAQINDHIYQGTDLTVKFASEISASPYNGDPWAWIKSRITAGNFTGIHIADYIPITTTNNITLNAQIAGINTYKNYGDSAVGSHIDFICKELWTTLRSVNPVNFNNGTAEKNNPWLASDLYLYLNSLAGTVPSEAVVGGGEGTAVDYTADGVYYFLPTQLKNVIIEKRFLLPKRYSASELLSDDNGWGWVNIGKLWIPNECEVYGAPVWGGKGGFSIGGSGLQYPLFAGNMNRLKFRNGGRYDWWLLSPGSGNSTSWCYVNLGGYCGGSYASDSRIAEAVCFRVG